MKKVNGEIIEATEKELRNLWMNSNWNSFAWPSFLQLMKNRGCKVTPEARPVDNYNYEKDIATLKKSEDAIKKEYDKKCQEYQTNVSAQTAQNTPSEQQKETSQDVIVPVSLAEMVASAGVETLLVPDSVIIAPQPTDALTMETNEQNGIVSTAQTTETVKNNSGDEKENANQVFDILATPAEQQEQLKQSYQTTINPELVKEVIAMKEKDAASATIVQTKPTVKSSDTTSTTTVSPSKKPIIINVKPKGGK